MYHSHRTLAGVHRGGHGGRKKLYHEESGGEWSVPPHCLYYRGPRPNSTKIARIPLVCRRQPGTGRGIDAQGSWIHCGSLNAGGTAERKKCHGGWVAPECGMVQNIFQASSDGFPNAPTWHNSCDCTTGSNLQTCGGT